MVLMDRPKTRHTRHERGAVGIGEEAQSEVEQLYWSLDDDVRAELIHGQVIVNAAPMTWHQRAVSRLTYILMPLCDEKGWEVCPDINFVLRATHEIFRPDLTIAAGLEKFPDSDRGVPAECALLVVEITSASTRKRDLGIKRKSYAKNDVPLFMIVDRFAQQPAVTLFSEPDDRDYAGIDTAAFGPGSGKLDIPEPFGITLDLSALPVPGPS
jgi:Uma2 family endonuclease